MRRAKTPADYRNELRSVRSQETLLREKLEKEFDAFKKQATEKIAEANRNTMHMEAKEVARREEIKRLTAKLQEKEAAQRPPSRGVKELREEFEERIIVSENQNMRLAREALDQIKRREELQKEFDAYKESIASGGPTPSVGDGDELRSSIRQLMAEREFVNKALSALVYRLAELEFERQASIIEGASKAASKAAGGVDPG